MGRGGQRWGRVCVSDRKLFVVHGTQGVIASTETGQFSRLLQGRASRSLAGPFRRPAPSSRTLQNGAGRVTARWPAWGPAGLPPSPRGSAGRAAVLPQRLLSAQVHVPTRTAAAAGRRLLGAGASRLSWPPAAGCRGKPGRGLAVQGACGVLSLDQPRPGLRAARPGRRGRGGGSGQSRGVPEVPTGVSSTHAMAWKGPGFGMNGGSQSGDRRRGPSSGRGRARPPPATQPEPLSQDVCAVAMGWGCSWHRVGALLSPREPRPAAHGCPRASCSAGRCARLVFHLRSGDTAFLPASLPSAWLGVKQGGRK